MEELNLKFDRELQGRFELKKLNLLLTFQVNCPGCFFYALPVVQKLFNEYQSEIGFLGLSTAFEDFELNTINNTIDLLKSGKLVGETKKALLQQGMEKLPFPINFPVAMDYQVKDRRDIEHMSLDWVQKHPEYNEWSKNERDGMRLKVLDYFTSLEEVSFTFTANQFSGTPTFVLFNDQYNIMKSWFGHVDKDTIVIEIEKHKKII